MTDLVLHHYPSSPFSEKVRLILSYKKLAYRSVLVPSISPKPDVVALTGGYRKTPFLQVGSHIYCDTALICEVLERLAPQPTLYPDDRAGLTRIVAQWADDTLFWAAMAHNFHPQGVAQLFGGAPDAPPERWAGVAKTFAQDRAQMRTAVPRRAAADATGAYLLHLANLADMLRGQAFLLGQTPSLADFCAYHPLWFTRTQTPVMADVLRAHAAVWAWMDRMAALGPGSFEPMTSAQAIALCAASPAQGAVFAEQALVDHHGLALGSMASITSDSFGPEPTVGQLVAATAERYTLRRQDARAGTVHVHFPRMGYVLTKAST